jgi:NADPH:quinone reductase-like Zn-dependent oxidoreductase
MLEANQLKHNVGPSFPLDGIVAAHQAQESGAVTGNIVVRIGA